MVFAFFDTPAIRNISSIDGIITYMLAFFVRQVNKPHNVSAMIVLGLTRDVPLVRIPSMNSMQKGMKNSTEIVSFASEENITGKNGNNAKNANSTWHNHCGMPIFLVYKSIQEKINGAAISCMAINKYNP